MSTQPQLTTTPPATATLCYVEGNVAWFTTGALADMWGDDWNDAPYQTNAGSPNEYDARYAACPPYALYRVCFDGSWLEPSETPGYSVEQMNARACAYLRSFLTDRAIYAGDTFTAFCATMAAEGCTLYVPIPAPCDAPTADAADAADALADALRGLQDGNSLGDPAIMQGRWQYAMDALAKYDAAKGGTANGN